MALPTLDATFASSADLPRKQMLAKWLVNLQYSGSVDDYWSLPEKYLYAKIAVASGATRSEADYISLPDRYIWSDIYKAVSGSSADTIDRGEKEALGWIAAAIRGDNTNTAAVATYIDWPWRYQVASIIVSLAVDSDAQSFITTSGATDIESIDKFVKGIKNLGLWNSMVSWPLRSSQNAGTGTTAYSLGGLGTFNGTLVNGPTWGADALDFAANNSHLTTAISVAASPVALVIVHQPSQAQGNNESVFFTAGTNINGRQFGYGNSASSSLSNFTALTGTWYNEAFSQLNVGGGTRTSRDYLSYRLLSSIAARISRNTTQSSSDQPVTGWDSSSPTSVQFGFYPTIAADDTLSFMAYFTAAINNTTDAAFFSLYKQTLGIGLGLP